jgi:hypothetical protein
LDIQISYKHSFYDPNFPDDQLFASLADLDGVFDALAEKCMYERVGGNWVDGGYRRLVYHPMGNDRRSEKVFLYYLDNIFSAKVSVVECTAISKKMEEK